MFTEQHIGEDFPKAIPIPCVQVAPVVGTLLICLPRFLKGRKAISTHSLASHYSVLWRPAVASHSANMYPPRAEDVRDLIIARERIRGRIAQWLE